MKELLLKIKEKIENDEEAKKHFFDGWSPRPLTFSMLSNAAGNHLFDDHPEWYGITEHEGHMIRSYFQSYPSEEELKEWGVIK